MDVDLLDRLQSYDECVRRVALQTLALQGPSAAEYAADVGKLLEDEEVDVRKVAANTLGKIGPAGCQTKRLAKALRDENSSIRAEAARSLGAMGSSGVVEAEKVAALARDPEEEAQLAAVESLSSLGQAMLLRPFLSSPFSTVRRVALVEVARDGQARVAHAALVADNLTHKDTAVRLAAVQASGEVGPACTAAHIAALGAFRTSEKQVKVRRAAVQALGRVGDAGVGQLLSFCGDADETIRHFTAQTLGYVGGPSVAAGALGLLRGGGAASRQTALLALGKLRSVEGLEVASGIAKHLHDDDMGCRLAAIQAMGELATSSQAEAVGSLRTDANKGIRQAAVNALAKMGTEGASQASLFLDDEDQAVRQAAVKVFSPLHSKLPAELARPHSDAITRKLLDEDWRVRLAVVVALGDLRASEYAEQVAALSGDDNNQVRRSAITTLEKVGAQPTLVAAFLGDEDAGVCAEAQRAFAALGGGVGGDDGELSEVE